MGKDRFDDIMDDEYRHPRSGAIQTADEAMGIIRGGAKRVSDTQRDDVIAHIAANVSHGVLSSDEAEARLDAAREAKTEGDLIHLARDLLSETELAQHKARKRIAKWRRGSGLGRFSSWLVQTKHGRILFHAAVAVLAAMVAVVPSAFVASVSGKSIGPVGVSIMVLTIAAGIVTFVIDVVSAISWYEDHT